MIAVQTTGTAPEPADRLALAAPRPPRGGHRGATRFQAQLADAAAGQDKPDADAPARVRRPKTAAADPGSAEPGAAPAPDGWTAAPRIPDPARAADQPGPTSAPPLPEAATPPVETAAAGTADPEATAAVHRRSLGADRPVPGTGRQADTAAATGPAPDTPGHAAPDERSAPAEASAPTSVTAPAQAHPAHALRAAQPGAAPALDGSSADLPATVQRAAAPPAARTTRREGPALPPPAAQPSVRLEPERTSPGGAAAAGPGPTSQPAADPRQPADVLVSSSELPTAGLDVTIAAATPDLRDRFRAAIDELHAELTGIGTEVDAIRVELRADFADGGAGGRADDGSAHDTRTELTEAALAEAMWGEPYAAVRPDLAEPDADATGPDRTGEHDRTGEEASAAMDGEADGSSEADGSGERASSDRRDQPDPQSPASRERLRLLLAPTGAQGAAEASPISPGRLDTDQPRRIDRYA